MTLSESKTETLLCIRGNVVAVDAKWKRTVEERNAVYDAMIASKGASDKWTDRQAQTLNNAQKDAGVTAKPPTTSSSGCQATVWDIYDAAEAQEREPISENTSAAAKKKVAELVGAEAKKTVSVALAAPDFLLNVSEAAAASVEARLPDPTPDPEKPVAPVPPPRNLTGEQKVLLATKAKEVMAGDALLASLAVMERCVQQNLHHEMQLR